MPRQAPLKTKIAWTELADSGLSVAEIRTQDKGNPDPRTIAKAIEQVRGQRRRALAKEIALQQGLKEHWHLLLDKLDRLPSRDFEWTAFDKNPTFAQKTSRLQGHGWTAKRKPSGWEVSLIFENTIEYELLKEHLPTDSFWQLLNTFKQDLGEALKARLALAQAVISKVGEASALKITKEETEPGLVLAGLNRLTQYLEVQAIKDGTSGLRLMVDDGAVRFEDTLVATPSGSTAEWLKMKIENAVHDLRGKDAWKGLLAAAAKVNRTGRKLAEESEVLMLSTVLPGECRSCARYSV